MTQKNLASVFESWLASYTDRLRDLLMPAENTQEAQARLSDRKQAENEA